MAETFKIKKGDKVVVIAGKDKGKKGEVISVDRDTRRLTVRGVNIAKRHQKATQMGQQAGIIQKEAALHFSNVMIEDPKDGKPTRIGYKFLEDGRKVRVARRSGEVIDR